MKIVDLNEKQIEHVENKLSAFDENYITYKMDGSIQIGIEEDGKLLISEMEKRAKEMGANTIRLDTFSWQGKEFYEALGYEVVGNYENTIDGYAEFFFLKRIG